MHFPPGNGIHVQSLKKQKKITFPDKADLPTLTVAWRLSAKTGSKIARVNFLELSLTLFFPRLKSLYRATETSIVQFRAVVVHILYMKICDLCLHVFYKLCSLLCSHYNFSFFRTSTCVSITLWKHRKCFLFIFPTRTVGLESL